MTGHDDHTPGASAGAQALAAHVAQCDECRAAPPPLARLGALLAADTVAIDTAALSRRTLVRLQPELMRLAAPAWWRRVAVAVFLALLPLPVVLAYDAYLLRLLYGVVSALLPPMLATLLVLSYGAFLVLLFAATYAAIPVVLARHGAPLPAEG